MTIYKNMGIFQVANNNLALNLRVINKYIFCAISNLAAL